MSDRIHTILLIDRDRDKPLDERRMFYGTDGSFTKDRDGAKEYEHKHDALYMHQDLCKIWGDAYRIVIVTRGTEEEPQKDKENTSE